MWVVAGLALVVWLGIAATMHGQQRLRQQYQQAMDGEDYQRAVAVLASYPADAFPPHFPPAPDAPFFGINEPLLLLNQELERQPEAAWALPAMRQRLTDYFDRVHFLREDDVILLAEVLPHLKAGPDYARHLQQPLEDLRSYPAINKDAEAIARIDRLLSLVETPEGTPAPGHTYPSNGK